MTIYLSKSMRALQMDEIFLATNFVRLIYCLDLNFKLKLLKQIKYILRKSTFL